MNELILELAALLLSLFCFVYSLTHHASSRRLEGGLSAAVKDRHLVYPVMLGALFLAAVLSACWNVAVLRNLSDWTGPLRIVHRVLHVFFFLCAMLYGLDVVRGAGLNKTERYGGVLLIGLVIAGEGIQMLWSVRVEMFFEAVACFGALAIYEQEREISDRFRHGALAAVAFIFLTVIVMNAALIQKMAADQSDELGSIQLDIIREDLQDTLSEAEKRVLRISIRAERYLEEGASREELAAFFDAQREMYLFDPNFMNVYIAGPDWHIVPQFDAPESFHANERVWYIGARENPGTLYITEPYLDANTGAMCITLSTLLADGETVVGMDLNFTQVQESISRMTRGTDRSAMIVTDSGMIVGYTDMNLVGEIAADRLPEYAELLRHVMSSKEHGSFETLLNGRRCVVFSAETGNNWYLILTVGADSLYGESVRQTVMMAAVNLLMLVVVVIYYLLTQRARRQAVRALESSSRYLSELGDKLRRSAGQILRLSDWQLIRENTHPAELVGEIHKSGEELAELADSVHGYSDVLRERAIREEKRARQVHSTEAPSRRVRNGIIVTLCVSLVIVLAFTVRIATNWGTTRLNREADTYQNQLTVWVSQQQSILSMFADMIAADPSLMDDYPNAVRLLHDIAAHYPQIAACYMANPYAEHPVIMNNGWEPGEDYRSETRPWYKAAERASGQCSISEPYLDVQTDTYCITFSSVVYGENDEFLGVFGIDFFLDTLIGALGESYASTGYAFLVDSEGVIINHPNPAYQMSTVGGVSIEDTEYTEAYHREGITVLRDYTGRAVSCLSRNTESGFTVVVANLWSSIYGSVLMVSAAFVVLFGFCITVIGLLINRLLRWQQEINRQLVEAADAAVSAGKAKSQFLAQMSHEIRTPMNAIIGLDTIALRDPDLPAQTRAQFEKIDASARHLLSLINDILDMSRIESGRMVLKEETFSFRDFLEQITVIINGQCADKGLHFVYETRGDLDACYVGDDLKLRQVLINILGNSVKFTDAPGTVSFIAEQLESAGERRTLRFTIRDTGIGMDKDFIPKLFEAFSQEDSTSTNRYGGSGLGMAITRSIIEMMGGTIEVESEKGVGSTFTVTVNLRTAWTGEASKPADSEEEAPEAFSLAGRHVLIAEDIALNAEILTDLLELEDITAEWAQNGRIAVDMFAASEPGRFDAILMDMRMPVMDGLEATRELRALDRPDARTVPIVALTANAFEENIKLCLEAGMNAHLSKPVDSELLMATLRRLLKE